jgi:RNA polymerase sigma-70 factor (TIGR02943 family)
MNPSNHSNPADASTTSNTSTSISSNPAKLLDFQTQVAQAQPMLLKYATLQLRNTTWAQDVVSDVVLTALEKPDSFSGKSSVKTWLVGILKFKIIDHFRHNKREATLSDSSSGDESGDAGGFEQLEKMLFNESGHSTEPQALWTNPSSMPQETLQEKHFFAVLEACVKDLPAVQGRVFMMREWLELSTEDICQELGVTTSNLWVLLHRARTKLQVCLNTRWFANQNTPLK